MSAARLFILVIAALAAIVLAFVVRGAFAPKKAPPPVAAATPVAAPVTRVLVAKRDLPVGTRLVAGDMGWQEWPASGLNPAYITDGAPPAPKETGASGVAKQAANVAGAVFGDPALQSFVGAVVREQMSTGEPILARKTLKSGEGNYMSVVVKPGHRAMSLPVSVDSAAGGFVLPGDRVDVMFSKAGEGENKGMTTRTLLRNIRVLAIDQTAEAAPDAKTMVGAVATLEVTASDAELMAGAQAMAKSGGFLTLALRSYADAGGPSGRGGGAATGAGQSVRVHKGAQTTEVMVSQ